MIETENIAEILSSPLPYSMERAADVLRKALKFFPELKNRLLMGSDQEKAKARKMGALICGVIDEEVAKTCQTLGIRMQTFQTQIVSYLTPQDALAYKDAFEFIQAHQKEIFVPVEHNKVRNLKPKSMRLRC
jgi:hypothetical protein